MNSSTKNILVLINQKTSPTDKNWTFFKRTLTEAIDDSKFEVTMGALCDFVYELSDGEHRIYDRQRGFSLDDFDLVVFRIIRKELARASSCASLLQEKGIPYIDSMIQPSPRSKYSAAAIRRSAGFNTIKSVYSNNSQLISLIEAGELKIPFPLVLKDVNGRRGMLNFVAKNKVEAIKVLSENPEVQFIIQEFVPNDGDYRFLVFGGKVVLVIHRQAQSGSHLNNTSQGGVSKLVDIGSFSQIILDDVVLAAKLEKLEVAGVDIMIDTNTNKHYVVEVNSSPQLATGGSPELKMKAYSDYLKSLVM